MRAAARLPDFLVIGAAKSATTWLSRELDRHPEVHVHPRELHYFSRHAARPLSWYASHFSGAGEPVIGEHSNTYLYAPEAAPRIRRALAEVKLIAVLRNPVDRAYSGYCMQLAHGRVSKRIEEYLEPPSGAGSAPSSFLAQGLYAEHLQRYLECFERARLMVVIYDFLAAEPKRCLAECCRFLAVDPAAAPAPGDRVNVRAARLFPLGLRRLTVWPEGSALLGAGLRWAARQPVGRWVRERLLTRPAAYPALSPELRARLEAFYAADVSALEGLLGLDLERWGCRGA